MKLFQQICKRKHVKLFSWKEFIHKLKVIQSFWCRYWFQITLWKLEALNMVKYEAKNKSKIGINNLFY